MTPSTPTRFTPGWQHIPAGDGRQPTDYQTRQAVHDPGATTRNHRHAGAGRVVVAAARQGPALLLGLGGGFLSAAAQLLFLTSLFAAALAFHNCTWRYMFRSEETMC
jgi:hypothetical protein